MERSYRWLLWTLVVFGLAADQASKYGVFAWLGKDGHGGEYSVARKCLRPTAEFKAPGVPHVNQGALFGFGNGHGGLANGVFAVISIIAAVAIAYWSTLRSTVYDGRCAARLILAGTLGNLYDRVVFQGVRDFIHWHYHSYDWPVFNVADCCLVCGAILLLGQASSRRLFPAPKTELSLVGSSEALPVE